MILYDRYILIQTLMIVLLRNVMLTVPKGDWPTCDLIFLISLSLCPGPFCHISLQNI